MIGIGLAEMRALYIALHILVGISHLTGNPEAGDGLLVVFRIYVEFTSKHIFEQLLSAR